MDPGNPDNLIDYDFKILQHYDKENKKLQSSVSCQNCFRKCSIALTIFFILAVLGITYFVKKDDL